MNTPDELVIPLSKGKIVLLFLGACGFVIIGVWMLLLDQESIQKNSPHWNPLFVRGAGMAAILFFGLCTVFAAWKLFDKQPGLVLNHEGIIDNSSGVAAGFIPWSEIRGAEILEMLNRKFLIIQVRSPEAYLDRGNPLKRMANRANYKLCGTPIAITSNTLKIDFPQLLAVFESYRQKFTQTAHNTSI